MIPQLMILSIATNLLFIISAQCSDAYTTSSTTSTSVTKHHNRHHHPNFRWQTSTQLQSSTTTTPSSTTSLSSTSDEEEENITTRDLLSLDYIRSTLIRQEETIIFALIERSQFRQNDICYVPGGVPGLGVPPGSNVDENESEEDFSFLDFMFTGTVCFFYVHVMCVSLLSVLIRLDIAHNISKPNTILHTYTRYRKHFIV